MFALEVEDANKVSDRVILRSELKRERKIRLWALGACRLPFDDLGSTMKQDAKVQAAIDADKQYPVREILFLRCPLFVSLLPYSLLHPPKYMHRLRHIKSAGGLQCGRIHVACKGSSC
jgi:hypothetical protein